MENARQRYIRSYHNHAAFTTPASIAPCKSRSLSTLFTEYSAHVRHGLHLSPTTGARLLKPSAEGWISTILADQGEDRATASVPAPWNGWIAYFIEMNYPDTLGTALSFTNDIKIVRDFLPFAADIDCDGEIEGDVDGNRPLGAEEAFIYPELRPTAVNEIVI